MEQHWYYGVRLADGSNEIVFPMDGTERYVEPAGDGTFVHVFRVCNGLVEHRVRSNSHLPRLFRAQVFMEPMSCKVQGGGHVDWVSSPLPERSPIWDVWTDTYE